MTHKTWGTHTLIIKKRLETTRQLPHETASGVTFRADSPKPSYNVLIKINESIIVVFHQHSFERLKWGIISA